MQIIFTKLSALLGYILAMPYFVYIFCYWMVSVLKGELGGGLFSSGFTVFVFTLPWSFLIEPIGKAMESRSAGTEAELWQDSTSFSLEHPFLYVFILAGLYLIAILINTGLLFLLGKSVSIIIHKMVSRN